MLDPHRNRPIPSSKPPIRGITLLEILIVLSIIAMLIAFFLPATRRSREPARRSMCKNNLKQIGLALHNYHDQHGAFPPAYTVDADGNPLHSWRTLILPLIDESPLYETIDLSKPWNDPVNAEAFATTPQVYACPSAVIPEHHTTYLALVSAESLFHANESRSLDETDYATSETVMVIEVSPAQAVHWMAPADADRQTGLGFDSDTEFAHVGGVNALFVDGHIGFVSEDAPIEERRRMMQFKESAP